MTRPTQVSEIDLTVLEDAPVPGEVPPRVFVVIAPDPQFSAQVEIDLSSREPDCQVPDVYAPFSACRYL